jgi:hypothetical protein
MPYGRRLDVCGLEWSKRALEGIKLCQISELVD